MGLQVKFDQEGNRWYMKIDNRSHCFQKDDSESLPSHAAIAK